MKNERKRLILFLAVIRFRIYFKPSINNSSTAVPNNQLFTAELFSFQNDPLTKNKFSFPTALSAKLFLLQNNPLTTKISTALSAELFQLQINPITTDFVFSQPCLSPTPHPPNHVCVLLVLLSSALCSHLVWQMGAIGQFRRGC